MSFSKTPSCSRTARACHRENWSTRSISGFEVKNTGAAIATGVRFQIVGIQFSDKNGAYYDYLAQTALDLTVYRGAEGSESGPKEITLVPGAAASIALGWWREDTDVVRPCVPDSFDYYDEAAGGVRDYLFKVVAFDDSGQLATASVEIHFRKPRRAAEMK